MVEIFKDDRRISNPVFLFRGDKFCFTSKINGNISTIEEEYCYKIRMSTVNS